LQEAQLIDYSIFVVNDFPSLLLLPFVCYDYCSHFSEYKGEDGVKAVVVDKPGHYIVKEIETPEPGEHDVLVKNHFAGFCGTDMHILKGDYLSTYPLIPGHEFAGTVEKTGKCVESFQSGDNVVIDPNICCNKCRYCNINEQNFCVDFGGYGVTENGGFAEYSLIRESNLHKVNGVSLEEAALLEPLACVIYGLSRIQINHGDSAVIFGAGPIGILLLQMLNICGVSKTVIVDINDVKLQTAKKFGATTTIKNDNYIKENLGAISDSGYDILIDATGRESVTEQIFEYADYNARILLYGVCASNSVTRISQFEIFRKNLSIYGAYSYNRTMPRAIELLNSKRINVVDLISHRYKLSEFDKALDTIDKGSHLKIVFDCRGG
jgi:D-arabinitol dehydrogenase (NADP+)